jgi:ribosome-binding factor A
LQRRVAQELTLKRTPALEFSYDDTTDRALRLERVLREEDSR